MFNIVLYAPEIPANTGNIGRTCVVTGARLHLIQPLGFSLDSRMLHRAGLGYWDNLDVSVYASWQDFLRKNNLDTPAGDARLHLLTKKARRTYAASVYTSDDFLVFGSESSGIPEEILVRHPGCCERIPMLPDATSLENRASWAAQNEALNSGESHARLKTDASPLLQQDICGNFIDANDYRISALNLSNAAAIVLYEALRQTGFTGMEG